MLAGEEFPGVFADLQSSSGDCRHPLLDAIVQVDKDLGFF
jgi:hypothetical protein